MDHEEQEDFINQMDLISHSTQKDEMIRHLSNMRNHEIYRENKDLSHYMETYWVNYIEVSLYIFITLKNERNLEISTK